MMIVPNCESMSIIYNSTKTELTLKKMYKPCDGMRVSSNEFVIDRACLEQGECCRPHKKDKPGKML